MYFTQPITSRLIVWLAAIAIPFQGMPTAACGCARTSGMTAVTVLSCCSQPSTGQCPCTGAAVCRCGESSSCCQSEPSCCSGDTTSESSCECGTGCQCGDNCQCGKGNVPIKPAAPPVENSSPERIVSGSASAATVSTVFLPAFSRQHLELSAGAIALTALASCSRLCRFTL
jgi:hypothetical protein